MTAKKQVISGMRIAVKGRALIVPLKQRDKKAGHLKQEETEPGFQWKLSLRYK
jgi:hypothetical protein